MSQREIVCEDLKSALDDLKREGFRLEVIYPADDPHTAILVSGDRKVRLTTRPDAERPSADLPPFRPQFILNRSEGLAGEGRAGMRYRDLIPGRLGGRYIASHILIPEGGPVADWVHFHTIAVQLIYVRAGWVRVVYEDQGEPFVMNAGDLVVQPPAIRHRVLESSANLEVIEITCPALHETFADHALTLPNGFDPDRRFGGQRFLHHIAGDAPWIPFAGGEAQETAVAEATVGLAEVRHIRASGGASLDFVGHNGELVFGFVLSGSGELEYQGRFRIDADDTIVIPPDVPWRIGDPSEDFRLLHVTSARLG